MTLEQYTAEAVTPVVDWYINQLATRGLEVVLAVQAAACIAVWCGLGATLHAIDCYRTRRARRAERQHMTHLADAINNAPQIPTQPGHDDDLLAACWDAWKAPDTRKDQP